MQPKLGSGVPTLKRTKASEVDRACKVDVIVSIGSSVAELINIELKAGVWQITTSLFSYIVNNNSSK